MNDQILQEFQQQIDRALQPLIAAPHRLKTMREELLSHLVETYNEELTRADSEQSARDAALHRFGDPIDVCNRLQASVPKFEHAVFSFLSGKETLMTRILWIIAILAIVVGQNFHSPVGEQIFFAGMALTVALCTRHLLQKENLASRYIGRAWPYLVGLFGFFFGMAMILPALAKFKQVRLAEAANAPHELVSIFHIEALTLGLLITLIGLGFIAHRLLAKRVQTS